MAVNNFVRYNDNLKVSFVKIENKVYNDINDMLAVESTRGASTVLYNDYRNEIDAYYFSSSAIFLGAFCSVYRKTYSQSYFDYVCTLSNITNFKDFNIHNNDYYEYMAIVSVQKSDGSYSYRLYENKDDYDEKIYSHTNWGDWSICNIEETTIDGTYTKTGDAWILGLNLEGENLTQNLSVTTWGTLGQYPKLSIGERDYQSSSVTCLLGRMAEVTVEDSDEKQYRYTERENKTTDYTDINDYTKRKEFTDTQYSRELEKYIKWKKFCSDGSLKLLKDIKGNAWIVQISASPDASLNTRAITLPTTISFNWAEVMSLDDISIIV